MKEKMVGRERYSVDVTENKLSLEEATNLFALIKLGQFHRLLVLRETILMAKKLFHWSTKLMDQWLKRNWKNCVKRLLRHGMT